MRYRLSSFLPYLLLALLTAILFYKLAFTNMILARGDAYSYFYPYWDARNAALQQGQLPLWTPDIFMGAPLLANPQLGTFYPPNWLMTWLPAPDGIRYSVLLHTVWAAIGVHLLFIAILRPILPVASRRKSAVPALCAAVIYGFGGAFTAHVEQINQLQGLAWLPWLFYFLHGLLPHPRMSVPNTEIEHPLNVSGSQLKRKLIYFLLLTAAFALQIFTGHTQTVFISGIGLAIYMLIFSLMNDENQPTYRAKLLQCLAALTWLGAAAVGGLILALPQILPTLELTGMSYRGGGGFSVQQATAFSLPLSYIGRSLLPSYDGQLFTEYIATPGVIGLGLALLALLRVFSSAQPTATATKQMYRWIFILFIIAHVGLLFAFGRYNPLYLLLADLPGFDLFRVPARWLALFGLGVAMLAGLGVQWLIDEKHTIEIQRIRPIRLRLFIVSVMLVGLMFLTRFVFTIAPEDMMGAAVPTLLTLAGWGVALLALSFLIMFRKWVSDWVIFSLVLLELFAASQIMPFNDLAPQEVYNAPRFTISQMQALNDGQTSPGRVLAISGLLFDVGDKSALETHFLRLGMDEQAIHTAFTAVKKQEMLFHNLPLTWGVPSIDGMDGGVLPTIHYSQFTSLLLPENTLRTTDGRLGEMLALPQCRGACIPDKNYLSMMGVQYIITDKIYDVWHEGVAYDTAWRFETTPENTLTLASPQQIPFAVTHLHLLYANADTTDTAPTITYRHDDQAKTLSSTQPPIHLGDFWLAVYTLDMPINLTEITISPAVLSTRLYATTAVDARTGDFVPLLPVGIDRVLSSDIKIYDIAATSSTRAVAVTNNISVPDTWSGSEDALNIIQQPEFSSNATVILHADIPPQASLHKVEVLPSITVYTPNRIEIHLDAMPTSGYLVLADAWYPGWKATVNGQSVPVYRANVMFRAVPVPSGTSNIVFYFEPDLWYLGIASGAVAWVVWIVAMAWVALWRR